MNSRQMQDSGLNDKVLCCCYLVQQYIMELGKGKEKNLKDIAHDQKDIETLGVPVVDASAKSVENVLDDKGRMTRRVKVEKAPVIKSAKLPDEIASIKHLQEVNNRKKLSAMRKDETDKEI